MFLKIKQKTPFPFFHSKVETGDEINKQLNLGNFVFDEENHEQKSWKFFGRTCNRSFLVFCANYSS